MVFCAIIGCANRNERDKGTYCRIPTVRKHEGPEEQRRSEERKRLWLKAIGRDDMTGCKLRYERVCWRHFVNGVYILYSKLQYKTIVNIILKRPDNISSQHQT